MSRRMMDKSGGRNCCIVGCFANQRQCKGLSFFRLPQPSQDTEKEQWRTKLLAIISREKRGPDKFNSKTAHICSRHFTEECLKKYGAGMTLKTGSLPTKFLPEKSIQLPAPKPRREPTRREPPVVPERVHYYTLEEIRRDSDHLEHPWFKIPTSESPSICFGILDDFHLKFKVEVDQTLEAKVTVQGISTYKVNFEKKNLKQSLKQIVETPICVGVQNPKLQDLAPIPSASTRYHKIITNRVTNSGFVADSTVRSRECTAMAKSNNICDACKKIQYELNTRASKLESSRETPVGQSTPLSKVSQQRLVNAVKLLRKQENQLKMQVEKLQQQANNHVVISESLQKQLKDSIDMSTITDPLPRLFWEQQKKAFATKGTGMRWHPMMIRLAIMLRSQSPAAYATLRESGVLKLPGESTLRDYTNQFQPSEGFNIEVLNQIKQAARNLDEHERYVVLLHDEMTIQSDLVFDHSGEVVGFLHPDRWDSGSDNLATHVLVFMIVGVNSNLKMNLGFICTKTATAADLMPLLWEAIGYLETYCQLKVIASTCDEATPNHRLYRLHGHPSEGVCFRALNMFASDRYVYFISDAPRLVKAVRDNISSSGWGKNAQLLWNDGKEILWKHIVEVYQLDQGREPSLTKLTSEHVQLTQNSVMNVALAAQVLSKSVSSAMVTYGQPEAQETAKFILLMDKFFDCLNVRSKSKAIVTLKPDLAKYESVHDERFMFLEEEFLGYLLKWKTSVEQRPGNFTAAQRNQMFLTSQTYEGLQRTIYAFIEATKFLLSNGVEYVPSSVFNQDPLEEHFSRHRGLGRSTNPNLWTFGYQEQKMSSRPRGNVRGEKRKAVVTTSPLKKPCR